jgi:hypothetical protein
MVKRQTVRLYTEGDTNFGGFAGGARDAVEAQHFRALTEASLAWGKEAAPTTSRGSTPKRDEFKIAPSPKGADPLAM